MKDDNLLLIVLIIFIFMMMNKPQRPARHNRQGPGTGWTNIRCENHTVCQQEIGPHAYCYTYGHGQNGPKYCYI